jgi:putative ABC transport system permease protein
LFYKVQNLAGLIDAARRISTTLTTVLMMLGGITLVISGVGIMNIMLATVTERTPEIGLRKAVGARRTDILYQFLIEAFVISGIGALLGILIAISIKVFAESFLPSVQIPISVLSIMIAFLVCCGTSIFFGYLPANKAARLQPTESLHYE